MYFYRIDITSLWNGIFHSFLCDAVLEKEGIFVSNAVGGLGGVKNLQCGKVLAAKTFGMSSLSFFCSDLGILPFAFCR